MKGREKRLALALFVVSLAAPSFGQDAPRRDADEMTKWVRAPEGRRMAAQADYLELVVEPLPALAPESAAGDDEPSPSPIAAARNAKPRGVSPQLDEWIASLRDSQERMGFSMETRLRSLLDREEWRHDLSKAERAKLRLAGLGDIKRSADRLTPERLELEDARRKVATGERAVVRIWRPREQTPDTFGDDSLFAKTLRKILREKAESEGR